MLKKIVIWILAIILSVFVLSVGLTTAINHTALRTHLVQLISKKCGDDIAIKGDFNFQLLPRIKLSVSGVSWQQKAQSEIAVNIEQLKVSLGWLPLLRGKMEVVGCSIVKPDVTIVGHLKVNQKSVEDKENEVMPVKVTEWLQKIEDMKNKIQCKKLVISDGNFSWLDLWGKKIWSIGDLDGSWFITKDGEKISLKIAKFYRNDELFAKKIGLKGQATIKTHFLKLELDEVTGEVKLPWNNVFLSGAIGGKICYEIPLARFSIDLKLRHPALSLETNLVWKTADSVSMPSGEIKLEIHNLKTWLNCIQFQSGLRELFDTSHFAAKFNLENESINAVAELKNGKISGKLTGSYYYHAPSKLHLIFDTLSVDEILLSLNKGSGKSKIDNSSVVKVSEDSRKFKLPSGIYSCRIDKIIYNKLQFMRNQIQLASDGKGNYRTTVLTAGYEAKPELELILSEENNNWQGNLAVKIDQLNLLQLLRDINGNQQIAGILALNAKFVASSTNLMDLWQHLYGTGNIAVTKGEYHGLDLAYELNRVQRMLNEDIKEIKVSNPPVTTFKEFKGSFKAVNSIFNSRDLVVLGESFKILGNSEINLKDQTIQADFEAGGVETRNFIIPIKITGKITTPKISLNTAILLKETVKQFASQTKRLIDGKWSGQLGNLLGDFASKVM